MRDKASIALVLTGLICLFSTPALAEDVAAKSAISDNPCPAPAPSLSPQMRAAMLKPGAAPLAVPPAQMEGYRRMQEAARARDFANVCRFRADNAALVQVRRPRVVFMGDSITEAWSLGDPSLFAPDVIDRGISGQTSPQMVLRFYQDVIALHPEVVHIMAGTNDVAGNTEPSTAEDYKNNIRAMVDMAEMNGIKVILASIPPMDRLYWQPDFRPAEVVRELNAWLRQFAAERRLVFADYYAVLSSATGSMKPEFTNDGVHPTYPGYAAMRPVFDASFTRTTSSAGAPPPKGS
jgi:lysophospholipase L1-like esterase